MKLYGRVSYQVVGEEEVDKSKSSLDVFIDDKKEEKDDKKEEKTEEKVEEKEEEKEEEGKEKKEEKEKEKEEEIIFARVDYEDIKKEFPEFFKKFPSLKHAFFREQQFTEIYPSVEDAKAAQEAQNQLEDITEVVINGNAEQFLTDLKDENVEGYKRFSSNVLPALAKTDRDLYLDILSPELSRFIKNVYEHGKKENDANIQNAAKIVRKIIFGGAYEDIEKEVQDPLISTRKTPNEEKLEKELAAENQRKYDTLHATVTTTCYNELDKEIERGLADLKGEKEGIKKLIAKDIRAQILDAMNKDGGYMNRMNAIWKKESRNNFSGTSLETFKATFLAKAKAILPGIRAKVRKETLGTEKPVEKEEEINRPDAGRHSSGKADSSKIKAAAKTSTRAIFDA